MLPSGDDDYFSSDLPDSTLAALFGRIDKPVLFLPAEEDEMVPPSVDREALLRRWMSFCKGELASDLSGFVPGADHVVSKPEAQKWIAKRVRGFLERL
jgi:pimeloyl-ACP methyl ester carboxylesterase